MASHWPSEFWGRFLPEQTTAVAMFNRLLHHATTVVTSGDSYRMKEARQRGGGLPITSWDHPIGDGDFCWPPVGTSTWPLTPPKYHDETEPD